VESHACPLDLDSIMRIALRAPMLGDPMSLKASTFVGRLDRMLERGPLERLLLVAHALADVARADPGAAEVFRASGLARQIRSEVEARKSGASRVDARPIVWRGEVHSNQESIGG